MTDIYNALAWYALEETSRSYVEFMGRQRHENN
jgi:hypothetical protein